MTLTSPYEQHNYIGEYTNDANALTFIQDNKWDTNGNGTGNPQKGMLYYNTTSDEILYWDGSSWSAMGGGLTSSTHRTLDQLTHNLDEDYYEEYIYSGSLVSDIITWTDVGKTTKIREENYTYTAGKVSQEVIIQYNDSGVEVERLTLTYAYTAGKITSVTSVRT